MALTFVLGSSGSGKSYYIYNKILDQAYSDVKGNYLVIVPEQFTMQTQKKLVTLHRNHCIQNIDVLSFERLCYRVFDELGLKPSQILEETGKNLLLRKVAEEHSKELNVLGGNITRMGYITELKSLISEFIQYGVTPETLEKVSSPTSMNFNMKLADIELLYRAFKDETEGNYVTSEQILSLLTEVAERSSILKNATVVFDGYTGFTPVQKEFIDTLLPMASDIYVTATIDSKNMDIYDFDTHEFLVSNVRVLKDYDLFYMSKKMMVELCNMAKQHNISVNEPVFADANKGRLKDNRPLTHLERNIFRPSGAVYREEQDSVRICSLSDPKEELKFVAQEICTLVRKKGYRLKDIAIVCGDINTYSPYVIDIMNTYDIPVFMDEKKDMLKTPFVEAIRALLQMIEKNFTFETVFRYLRSGFADFTDEETDVLENYVRATGVRGLKRWSEKFIYLPKGFEWDINFINELRERFVAEISPLSGAISSKNIAVAARCEAIKAYLNLHRMEERLEERACELEDNGDKRRADEYRQAYEKVIGIIDKMDALIGGSAMNLKEFIEIMDAALEEAKVGVIPTGYDRVVIGDIERTRLDNVKALFLIGTNEGAIPKASVKGGIISEAERELFKDQEVELAPSEKEKTFMQKFYLYMILTKPSQKLYITFARVSSDGSSMRRSYLVSLLLKMFEGLEIENIDMSKAYIGYVNRGAICDALALSVVGEEVSEETAEYLACAIKWIRANDDTDYNTLLELIKYAAAAYRAMPLSKEVSEKIYGKILDGSVTRMEKYAACSYAHFLTYGLKLKERAEVSFGGLDMGNIIHTALEKYAGLLKENGNTFRSVPRDKSDEYLEVAMRQSLEQNHNLSLYEGERESYTLKRIARYLRRTVDIIQSQVKNGRFEPTDFEKEFFMANGDDMNLRGKIDRIDVAEIDGKIYLNVVDYKTGQMKFSFEDIFYGRQLQLSVYMAMALDMYRKKFPDKEIHPGGMFYFRVKDDLVEGNYKISDEALDKKILEEFALDGIANDDPEVFNNMDFKLRKGEKSDVLGFKYNANGSLPKNAPLMSEENFEDLLIFVENKTRELADKIKEGDVEVNPYKNASQSSCTYCKLKSVCKFDERLEGFRYNELLPMNKEEVLAAIQAGFEE